MFLPTSDINNPLLGTTRKTGEGNGTGQGVSLSGGVAGQVVEVPTGGPRHAHRRLLVARALTLHLFFFFTTIIYIEWMRLRLRGCIWFSQLLIFFSKSADSLFTAHSGLIPCISLHHNHPPPPLPLLMCPALARIGHTKNVARCSRDLAHCCSAWWSFQVGLQTDEQVN